MKKPVIIGMGEILWDMLPDGKVLGGAPANFAYHCKQLGADGFVISAVGRDELGSEVLNQLNGLQISSSTISVTENYPTSTVDVRLSSSGHPTYTIHENVAWDHMTPSESALSLISSADAVCFGSLAQRSEESRETIRNYLSKTKTGCIKVFDINLRQDFYSESLISTSLRYADILKLNDEELLVLEEFFGLKDNEEANLKRLIEIFNLKLIALTKGEEGSILCSPDEISAYRSDPVKVIDSVGAGDSFTAGLVTGILTGVKLKKTHRLASELAAYVCTKNGGTPELPEDFLSEMN